MGLDAQGWIQAFFQGNATVAILILVLIMVFLFREGGGFFPQYLHDLGVYRKAGLEYVDSINRIVDAHTGVTRLWSQARAAEYRYLTETKGMTPEAATEQLKGVDALMKKLRSSVGPLRPMQMELRDAASELKAKQTKAEFVALQSAMEERRGNAEAAAKAKPEYPDFAKESQVFERNKPRLKEATETLRTTLAPLGRDVPAFESIEAKKLRKQFIRVLEDYLPSISKEAARAQDWRWDRPVRSFHAVTGFLFGKYWITNSPWQDFYGALPLIAGSVMISILALALSIPFGVGAALFVNQVAGPKERNFIKPAIEFIQAIPSVVLGFFGVTVLGQGIFWLSQQPWLAWVPFFPIQQRLNIFTAGCLLALMAIPIVFTLAEDAINNVPQALAQASLALGATRLQTMVRITVPAALSGIIAAVLLGFGRVIGETMVVLLVAGNRIAIPDFSAGLGAFFQPAHTMTGIIAQEMGEVPPGSLHYRGLFLLGILLFLVSLILNWLAQKIVTRYRLPSS